MILCALGKLFNNKCDLCSYFSSRACSIGNVLVTIGDFVLVSCDKDIDKAYIGQVESLFDTGLFTF